ncbi:MAG: thioredoxin family protein [Patescibacteria group bacterium]
MDEKKGIVKDQQFLLGLFGGIAVVAVIGLIVLGVAFFTKSKGNVAGVNEQNQNTNAADQTNQQPQTTSPETETVTAAGVKTFSAKKGATICQEDGKPVIYLFSTTWCPHCQWISDTFDATVKKYVDEGKIVAYHWELDTNDNTLTSAKETQIPAEATAIYQEFNPQGSIPTFVFGCKYFRVGNGYEQQQDLAAEKAEFEAAINDLLK